MRYLFILGFIFISNLVFTQSVDESLFILNDGLKESDFISQLEKEIIIETNLARTNPQKYAEKLKEFKKFFKGRVIEIPGEIRLMTNEGISAVEEAIDFLEKTKPVGILKTSRGMSRAALDHAKDQGPTGGVGHYGSDGSNPFDRINRYGQWQKTAGENVAYGPKTAERIVMQLLIDDGVVGRGHRLNIFNPSFKVIGIGFGKHKRFGTVCVMDLAGGYTEK